MSKPKQPPTSTDTPLLRIGTLGAAVGVDVETIRYYEKIGLLPPPARSANGYRAYGQEHIERLAFIRHCRSLDISLADIAKLLEFMKNPSLDGAGVDDLVANQLARVRGRLASLRALEKQLMELISCCAKRDKNHHLASECPVLQELVTAARGEACVCHKHNAPNKIGHESKKLEN